MLPYNKEDHMAPSVSYDYDDMRCAVNSIKVVDFALMGLMDGMSEGAISGMIELLRDVVRSINPENGTLLKKAE